MTKPRVSDDVAPLAIGDVVGQKYVVESRIGEGAFAVVYAARHQSIASLRVAIKVLKPARADSAEVRRRFQREALTAASLNSPFTVSVMDVGETAEGLPYMVLEYIDGEPLDVAISRSGRLGDRVVGMIAIQVLHALNEAHAHGIMHRDIKPANLMLVHDKKRGGINMKVLDFGIARIFDDTVLPMGDGTVTTSVHCTPLYASPELLRGEPSALGDIYALGISLIQALDGRPPYLAATAYQVANLHLDARPVPLGPHASTSRLAPIIRRATEKNPLNRYQSVGDMLDDLEREFRAELGTGALSARIPTADFEIPETAEVAGERCEESETVMVPTQVLPPRPVSFGAVTRGESEAPTPRVSYVESSDLEALADDAGVSPAATQGRVASSQPVAVAPPEERADSVSPTSGSPAVVAPSFEAHTAEPETLRDARAESSLAALLSGPQAASNRLAMLAGAAFLLASVLLLVVALPLVSGASSPNSDVVTSAETPNPESASETLERAGTEPTPQTTSAEVQTLESQTNAVIRAQMLANDVTQAVTDTVTRGAATNAARAAENTSKRVAERFSPPAVPAPPSREAQPSPDRAAGPERTPRRERRSSARRSGSAAEATADEASSAAEREDQQSGESEPANPFGGLQPMGL